MVVQNRGSIVLFWVPTLKVAVPPPPPPPPRGTCSRVYLYSQYGLGCEGRDWRAHVSRYQRGSGEVIIFPISLITGRGGYNTEGGAHEVLPLRKGGGAKKVLALLKGGTESFGVETPRNKGERGLAGWEMENMIPV